jgi:predicted transcriptional regulator of viral defense system
VELAETAERQHGIVDAVDLARLGFGRGAIQHQLKLGRLHRLYRGVYAVGHTRLTLHGRWFAGVRSCGAEAALSHRTAATSRHLMQATGGAIHVTVVGSRRPKQGIVLHQVRALDPRDRTLVDGIPVTSIARTFLDLAETESEQTLSRVWDEAERRELLDVRAVRELCERSAGRRGLKPLLALLADTREVPHTKRELEALFFDFCRAYKLPLPSCNVLVEGYEVDAFWPSHKLVVELDSWTFHRGRRAFERDRERLGALQAAGYRVIPITWRRLTRCPAGLAEQLHALMR